MDSKQQSFGRVVDEAKAQAGDIGNRVRGAADDLYDQAQKSGAQMADAASRGAGATRDTALSLEGTLRSAIERQPYTAAIIALAIGWLLGRSRQPL